jgi:plasmid stabilization system protein ParE
VLLPAAETVALITEAAAILHRHPYMDRAVRGGLHELAISRGHSGYVALHRINPVDDAVPILSIRHQREAGFSATK